LNRVENRSYIQAPKKNKGIYIGVKRKYIGYAVLLFSFACFGMAIWYIIDLANRGG